jgi:hypothetical protein
MFIEMIKIKDYKRMGLVHAMRSNGPLHQVIFFGVAQLLWFALVAGSVPKTVSESDDDNITSQKFTYLFSYQCLSLLISLPLAQQSSNSQCSLSLIPKSLL